MFSKSLGKFLGVKNGQFRPNFHDFSHIYLRNCIFYKGKRWGDYIFAGILNFLDYHEFLGFKK